ncbi:hypothetical protein M011DRAFT_468301 [Sporormia fimetaria CBS 119925]|uniref:Uncharacterized protein n=1 Tax=Sporormia fimetaria CBS 119925 TaxID=1340428 RepID=A0A6A6V7V2_9PLEO|nr:hypothetical protein M011DRAFT_468301 [Sporormia fimetaria CBS 119925]
MSSNADNPPAYNEPPNTTLEPTTFLLSETNILTETPNPTPLYTLSRAVARLTKATKEVEFSRIEHTVTSPSDEPQDKPRARHIYNLKYMVEVPGGLGAKVNGSTSPVLFLHSMSRRNLYSHVGIRRSRLHPYKKEMQVLPIELSEGENWGLPKFKKDAKPIFTIRTGDEGAEWMDGNGRVVAVEERSEEKEYRFVMMVELERGIVDVLVALWCARVWQGADEGREKVGEGIDEG